jgi:hypothetical protein
MTNADISELLAIDANFLSRRCCNNNGLTLWLLRECLIREHRLMPRDKPLVISLLAALLQPNNRVGDSLNLLVANNLVILGNTSIHNTCMGLIQDSPQIKRGVEYDKI